MLNDADHVLPGVCIARDVLEKHERPAVAIGIGLVVGGLDEGSKTGIRDGAGVHAEAVERNPSPRSLAVSAEIRVIRAHLGSAAGNWRDRIESRQSATVVDHNCGPRTCGPCI